MKKTEKDTTPNPVYTTASKVPYEPSSSTDVTDSARIRMPAAATETIESQYKPVSSIDDNDTTRSQNPFENEEKDEDILKSVFEKMDTGSGSKGSSTLLLTETIPEEDEDVIEWPDYSRHPGPHAKIPPAVYDVHHHEMTTKATSDILPHNYDVRRHGTEPKMGVVETDLDIAAFLLDPKLLLPGLIYATETPTTETSNVESKSREDTTKHVVKHTDITIEEYMREEITTQEEVKEIPKESTEVHIQKNVSFQEKEQDIVNECETESAADINSETSSTSQEGEICYNSLGEQQMQSLAEDKELRIQEIQPPPTEAHITEVTKISLSEEEMLKEYIPTRRERIQSTESEETSISEDDTSSQSTLHENDVKTALYKEVDQFAISEATHLEDVQFQHLTEGREPSDVTEEVYIQVPNILLSPPERNFPPPPTPPPRVIVFEEEYAQEDKEEHPGVEMASDKENNLEIEETDNDNKKSSPIPLTYSQKLEINEFSQRFSDSTHGMLDDFSAKKFGLEMEVRLDNDKNTEGPASTTGATVGEEYSLALDELDEDILYEEENLSENEVDPDEEDIKSSTTVEKFPEKSSSSAQSSPEESASRSTSLSDITDNTDELCESNMLEKTWSMGAGLDEDDELFQILFRRRPRRHRRGRNRSEINPREVPKMEAVAFKSTLTEIQSPKITPRRDHPRRRRFIPSWPFDAAAIFSYRDLNDLDREAIQEAMDAHRELMAEEQRIEEMDLYGLVDVDYSTPECCDDFLTEEYTVDLLKTTEIIKASKEKVEIEKLNKIPEKSLVTKSPSTSPRMIGETFIPGIPDFARSVALYNLRMNSSSFEARDPMSNEKTPSFVSQVDPENLKYPKSILKFPVSNEPNGDVIDYTPPTTAKMVENDDKSPKDDVFSSADIAEDVPTSSGRSSPHSGIAASSQSEFSSSSTSKASTSSFPRFIHSVFPLRRSSSSDNRRGRSKTRRKREKKIVNKKNKKSKKTDHANTKTKESKISSKPPTIEITSPQSGTDEKFPSLPSPPHYTSFSHTEIQAISQYFPSAAKIKLSPRQDDRADDIKEEQQVCYTKYMFSINYA